MVIFHSYVYYDPTIYILYLTQTPACHLHLELSMLLSVQSWKQKNGGEDQVLTVAYVLADIERSLPSIPIPASPKTEEKNR